MTPTKLKILEKLRQHLDTGEETCPRKIWHVDLSGMSHLMYTLLPEDRLNEPWGCKDCQEMFPNELLICAGDHLCPCAVMPQKDVVARLDEYIKGRVE